MDFVTTSLSKYLIESKY